MVIEGVQQYQEREDLIALLKLLALGEKGAVAQAFVQEVRVDQSKTSTP